MWFFCPSVCGYVHMSTYAHWIQKRILDPLELELQVVVTHTTLTWVLWNGGSHYLTTNPSLQPLSLFLSTSTLRINKPLYQKNHRIHLLLLLATIQIVFLPPLWLACHFKNMKITLAYSAYIIFAFLLV